MTHIEQIKIAQQFENFAKGTIFNHTCQILKRDDANNYTPLGTGVLVNIKTNYYLFTVAHVSKFQETPRFYVPTIKGKIEMKGSLFVGDFPGDKVDVAYFLLEQEIIAILKLSYSFLTEGKILNNPTPNEIHTYFALGYPEKNIWNEDGKVITGTSGFFLSLAKEKVYEYYKCDFNSHVILEFSGAGRDTQKLEKTKINTEPYGMSGCGLWVITGERQMDNPKFDYSLIAIMTEYRKGKYLALIGCRIEIILRDLRKYF